MKIAWCSPLSRRSGISKFTLAATRALSGSAQVDLWSERRDDNFVVPGLKVHELLPDDTCVEALRGYDAVIYNLGNNADFHSVIHWIYARLRGVVILHDKFMHHFFAGHYLAGLESLTAYAKVFRHYYGDEAKNEALKAIRRKHPVWETDRIASYPLFEPCIWNATGLVVHSQEAFDRVAPKAEPVPVRFLHHPFYITHFEYGDLPLLSRSQLGLPEDRLVLLSHGFINANKRIDRILNVVAESPELRGRVFYVVAGGTVLQSTTESLMQQVERLGLQEQVRFTGFIDDHTLHSYVQAADICLNLRFPSIESSSGSLVEQLYFGKPVVVTRIGSYDELPDECVVKIDMADEEGALAEALLRLVDDPDYRAQVAEAGFQWAQEHCSAERYATSLLEFLENIRDDGQVLDFIDGISDTLSEFLHPGLQAEFVSSISGEIHAITG